jgi:site-specific recombinase XerD
MLLQTALDEFLIAGEADGLSRSTLRWYASLLGRFSRELGAVDLDAVTTASIRQYIIRVRRTYSEDTAAGTIRALHKFWKWCSAEYDHRQNPMRNVKYAQPVKRRTPAAVDPLDVVRIFHATHPHLPIGIRDRAIIAMLVDSTARAGGIVTMQVANMDLTARRAIVQEKGMAPRAVIFSPFTLALVEQWMEVRSEKAKTLFHSMKTCEPLTVSGLQQLMRRLKKRAGVTGKVNPHSFRHGFAREYLKAGGDLATLHRLMGHKDMSTTAEFYAVFASGELGEFHDEHSPISLLQKSLGLDETPEEE